MAKINCDVSYHIPSNPTRKRSRVFFLASPLGDSNANWDAVGAMKRAEQAKLVMERLQKASNVHLHNVTKLRWSQKAGCSCGCSPAFVADGEILNAAGDLVDVDIHVEVVG